MGRASRIFVTHHNSPLEAVLDAWTVEGPNPRYHVAMMKNVRESMPVLAEALDWAAEQNNRDIPGKRKDV